MTSTPRRRQAPRRPLARSRIGARQLATLLGEWDSAEPVYAALSDRIRLLLSDGRLATHTRLPAERELAEELGRSRTTIVAAYRALRESGHLISMRGSGSVLVLPRALPGRSALEVDFARSVPAPVAGLDEIVRAVADRAPTVLEHSGFDLVGQQRLRESIAARYTEHGARTGPDQILITLGAQNAIALTARTVLRHGDRVLIETPTYPHAYEALRNAGGRLVSTPVTTTGWEIDHLVSAIERVRPELIYLIPDFHNPTGSSMNAEQRERVIASARRNGALVLIDETTADLDIDRPDSPPTFPSLTTTRDADTLVSVGSLSKTIWGGLRVGWIRAEPAMISRLITRRPADDLGTPVIEQLIATRVLECYDLLLTRRADQLRAGRDLLVSLLRTSLPDWRIPDVHGGLALWVELGAPLSSALASACQPRGVRITAGPRFGIDGARERFIRVPFTAGADHLERGVRILREAWESLDPVPTPGTQTPPHPML
ncbi:GntR family transcriptional regulator [Dietzia natronolimnaea]|uniref:GntR family transcriptional regulator n=1 Tax=Dietzia natronolimnaea TaxID=161920 RepID=A0A2A2WLR0_9ACTN|nr:PLP-dependent aminotransferase family protein [Dietzia natronolimnaea]PAY22105.1 GntR family transcriptional regulator [Dietzia natronolimnaea]